LGPLERIHDVYIVGRRSQALAGAVAPLLAPGADVIDVGCGDGRVAEAIQARRPDVSIRGLDVVVRPKSAIPVERFDGRTLPVPDGGAGAVLFIDVLHHTTSPTALLREARRVATTEVVVKDHLAEGLAARRTLEFMDHVGNKRHGVDLPYTYLRRSEWRDVFDSANLRVTEWREELDLYPFPLRLFFGRSLHFLVRLVPS
jgi:SAM-dependent methyltransferase